MYPKLYGCIWKVGFSRHYDSSSRQSCGSRLNLSSEDLKKNGCLLLGFQLISETEFGNPLYLHGQVMVGQGGQLAYEDFLASASKLFDQDVIVMSDG